MNAQFNELPIPDFFVPERVGEVWRVPYEQRAAEAKAWAAQQGISPAAGDTLRLGLLLIDVQNTFCIPGFELYVGGRSQRAAVEDNQRLCQFIYRNLGSISEIIATLDTHRPMQVFHPLFWINDAGEHPQSMTTIELTAVESGTWRVNPRMADNLHPGSLDYLQAYALHYVRQLQLNRKYALIIWPYHALLGGISHALVAAVGEACFFHAVARDRQTHFVQKGSHPLTENYSALQPEVLTDHTGAAIATANDGLIEKLLSYDVLVVAGQAKSHCVAWTVSDLLSEIQARDPQLARKVYLLEDCTSAIAIGETLDFTPQAEAAFQRFAQAGMHRVSSTAAIAHWPAIPKI